MRDKSHVHPNPPVLPENLGLKNHADKEKVKKKREKKT